jgi:multidrug efflux pump
VRVERVFADPDSFARLPVRVVDDGHVIRLGEVADVELAAEETRALFRGNGQNMIGIGFVRQSQANSVAVADAIRVETARIEAQLPEGMQIISASDDTVFIKESIAEVWRTFAVAATLVVLVIYLFLGSFRAAVIPALVVPVCLIGVFAVLAAAGYSINILTLLALVLAIGLVVDDSIVVLENIQRRVDLGESPMLASQRGGNQVFFAVVATTAVLAAVFVPLIFLPGLIGRIFAELAVAISGAVILSSFVALTLSPMMTSKLLKPSTEAKGPAKWVGELVERVRASYRVQPGSGPESAGHGAAAGARRAGRVLVDVQSAARRADPAGRSRQLLRLPVRPSGRELRLYVRRSARSRAHCLRLCRERRVAPPAGGLAGLGRIGL